MLQLKAHTTWGAYDQPGYTQEALTRFLAEQLVSPDAVCVVWDTAGRPDAFCGGRLSTFVLPPFMPLVFEWGWAGSPRAATRCWQRVRQWGKQKGAQMAYRAIPYTPSSKTRIRELVTWEVL